MVSFEAQEDSLKCVHIVFIPVLSSTNPVFPLFCFSLFPRQLLGSPNLPVEIISCRSIDMFIVDVPQPIDYPSNESSALGDLHPNNGSQLFRL